MILNFRFLKRASGNYFFRHVAFLSLTLLAVTASGQKHQWVNLSTTEFIYAIEEEKDTLWLGTDGGLIKWNKSSRVPVFYNKEGKGGLMSCIKSIAIDKDGVKWIATEKLGLIRLKGNDFRMFNTNTLSGWRINNLEDVKIDKLNNKWVTSKGYLIKLDSLENFTDYSFPPEFNGLQVNALAIDNEGNKLIGTEIGLLKYDTTFKRIKSNNVALDGSSFITALAVGKDSTMYVGCRSTIQRRGGFYTMKNGIAKKYDNMGDEINSIHIN